MARKFKTQIDPSVAERLINAAEELYGLHGLEGVSLRHICQAAGTNNNYAVQYHFGDVPGLIRAVYLNRVPILEAAIARRLKSQKKTGGVSTRSLLDTLLRPCLESFGRNEERILARFMLMLSSTPSAISYLEEIRTIFVSSQEILELLHVENPHVPAALLRERVRLVTVMFLNSVFTRIGPFADPVLDDELIENAIDMASMAVSAPAGAYAGTIIRQLEADKIE
jgi:AcrR family transcriptional regulator